MIRASQNPLKGAALSLLGFSLFAVGDAVMKHLSTLYPISHVLFYDLLFLALTLMALSPWLGGFRKTFRSRQKKRHFLRGGIGIIQLSANMYAFSQMSLAKTYSLLFCSPIFTVLLAALLMKEKATRQQWLAIAMGFGGVLTVLRPGFIPLELPVLAALTAALGFSAMNLIVKTMNLESETPAGLGLFPTLVTLAGVTPWFLMNAGIPALSDLPFFVALGMLSAGGFVCVSLAFIRAPAAIAAPFNYTQMLWAILFGYFIFGDSLDLWTGLGAALIIASGLWLLRRSQTPESVNPVS